MSDQIKFNDPPYSREQLAFAKRLAVDLGADSTEQIEKILTAVIEYDKFRERQITFYQREITKQAQISAGPLLFVAKEKQ
jgi:hypothetical protein